MKQIQKDELYLHLNDFLKSKGVELKEGSYTQKIRKGCALLSDAVNLSQQGVARAKAEINSKLEQMRQVIHEKTAPRTPTGAPETGRQTAGGGKGAQPPPGRKPSGHGKAKTRKARRPRS